MNKNAMREYYHVIKNMLVQQRFEAALSSISKLLAQNPNDEHGFYYKGVCEFALEKYKDSLESYNKTVQLDPSYAKAYFNIGVCYYIAKKYDPALINFGKALIIFTKRKELDKKQRCIEALKRIEKERIRK